MAEGDSGYGLTTLGNNCWVCAARSVEGLHRLLRRLKHPNPGRERELSDRLWMEEWLPRAFHPASIHPRMIVVSSSRSLVKNLDRGNPESMGGEIEGYITPCSVKKVETLQGELVEKSPHRSRTEDSGVCRFASPPRKGSVMAVRLVWDEDWVEVGSPAWIARNEG